MKMNKIGPGWGRGCVQNFTMYIRHCQWPHFEILLPPANEVCEDYVFTRVCHSVHGGGGGEYLDRYPPPGQVHPLGQVHSPAGTPPWAGTPPGRYTPLGRYYPSGRYIPLGAVHAGRHGEQAGGTHPTGMHSCSIRADPFCIVSLYVFFNQIFIKWLHKVNEVLPVKTSHSLKFQFFWYFKILELRMVPNIPGLKSAERLACDSCGCIGNADLRNSAM